MRIQVNHFMLEYLHDPEIPDVLWRVVTCSTCGRELARGTLSKDTAPDIGILDALVSLGHECQIPKIDVEGL